MRKELSPQLQISRPILIFSLISLVLISLIGYSIYLYQYISNEKTVDFTKSEQRVKEELDLASIDQITRFHGVEYFHVVEGRTADQEDVVVFINQTDEMADLILFSKDDWVNESDILNHWRESTPYQEIYRQQYGLRNEIPLIEIVYIDQRNRLSYDYYRLDNGEYDSGISFANK